MARAVCLNEGALPGVMGHAAVEAALRDGFAHVPGWDAAFVTLAPMPRWARVATASVPFLGPVEADLQATRWHLVQSLRARSALARAVRGRDVDLVHVDSHSVALALGEVAEPATTVLSVDVTFGAWREMGVWRPARPWSRRALVASEIAERRSLHRAGLVAAWTEWARRCVLEVAPAARVVVVHPGIDVRRFSPGSARRPGRPRLLFVGGRFREKGGLDLLEALRPSLGSTVELDVVTTEAVPATEGVRVHRLGGGDPRLVELYQQADVLCLPSRGDAAPFVVLEAMACATPVVAADVGGVADLLGGGQAGRVVPPGDVGGLRRQLQELLDDPQALAALGAAARTRAEEHYDNRRQLRRLLDAAGFSP